MPQDFAEARKWWSKAAMQAMSYHRVENGFNTPQKIAFALAFAGIFCLSVAIIALALRVNALEKAQTKLQPLPQPQQSSRQPKSICPHNERGQVGQLRFLFWSIHPSFLHEDFCPDPVARGGKFHFQKIQLLPLLPELALGSCNSFEAPVIRCANFRGFSCQAFALQVLLQPLATQHHNCP